MADTVPYDFPSSSQRKFTLSCSRCRASKLKCDRKEPCSECVTRHVGHLCTKDERQTRAKRIKSHNKDQIVSQVTPDEELEIEETAQVLENFVDGTTRPITDSSSVAPDFQNRYWVTSDAERYNQKLTLIRELVQSLPEWEIIQLLYDIFVTRCQGPLGNIVHTPTFMKQAEQFHNCFSLTSPEAAIASTLSMDCLACLLLAVDLPPQPISSKSSADSFQQLVLGLAFHPTPSLLGWTPSTLTFRVEQLRASDKPVTTWRSLAVRCLQGDISLFCGSIPSLQAAIMLLVDAQQSLLELDGLLVTAISGARKLGLHRLGNVTLDVSSFVSYGSSVTGEVPHIRIEIGIRVWWSLVMRDWSRGQALGYYTILPSQFNTRMPLHLNDDDLLRAHTAIPERPRSEFTMLSYTVHALELVSIVRELIDLGDAVNEATQKRQHLHQKYEQYVTGLPSYFRMGSTVGLTAMGPMAAIPVQRFMLHQQLWSLLLRLHRANLSSPMSRASCHLLAQNIIATQAQIQARCAVCSSLSINDTQLFNATVVLVLGLLVDVPLTDADRSSTQLSRLMMRDKVREGIELLRSKSDPQEGSTPRSVVALEALMELEEKGSGSSSNRSGENGMESDRKRSLYLQVVDILKTLSRPVNPPGDLLLGLPNPGEAFQSLYMPLADGFPDLDVMPILSNDLSPNVWNFLDFQPPPDQAAKESSIAMAGDAHRLTGIQSSSPPSGVTIHRIPA